MARTTPSTTPAQPATITDDVVVPTTDLLAKLATLATDDLAAKTFSTGSVGFFAQGKLGAAGERYQASVSVILVGSKSDPSMRATADRATVGRKVADMIANEGMAKTFASGRRGVFAQGKITAGDQRYQVSAMASHVIAK